MPVRSRRILPLLLLPALAALSGCGALTAPFDGEGRRLAEARRTWERQGLDRYAFTLQRLCFCAGPVGPLHATVHGDSIVDLRLAEDGAPVPATLQHGYPTVAGLFRIIEDAIARRAHVLEVAYHATLGYPTTVVVDYSRNVADDEFTYRASEVRPVP